MKLILILKTNTVLKNIDKRGIVLDLKISRNSLSYLYWNNYTQNLLPVVFKAPKQNKNQIVKQEIETITFPQPQY